jgi:hypothetical protein
MHAHRDERNRGERCFDLDHYLLCDPHTRRVRFTRTGQDTLAARFAGSGVDLWRLRTLEDVEAALARVTHRKYHRLTALQKEDDALVNAIYDLDFITDGITDQPLLPLKVRRERRHQGFKKLLAVMGITPEFL